MRAGPVVAVSAMPQARPPERWAQVSAVLAKPARPGVPADAVRAAIDGSEQDGAQ